MGNKDGGGGVRWLVLLHLLGLGGGGGLKVRLEGGKMDNLDLAWLAAREHKQAAAGGQVSCNKSRWV